MVFMRLYVPARALRISCSVHRFSTPLLVCGSAVTEFAHARRVVAIVVRYILRLAGGLRFLAPALVEIGSTCYEYDDRESAYHSDRCKILIFIPILSAHPGPEIQVDSAVSEYPSWLRRTEPICVTNLRRTTALITFPRHVQETLPVCIFLRAGYLCFGETQLFLVRRCLG